MSPQYFTLRERILHEPRNFVKWKIVDDQILKKCSVVNPYMCSMNCERTSCLKTMMTFRCIQD